MTMLKTMAAMAGITLASHLGLTSAISKVLSRILGCSTCSTFWGCLAFLVLTGEDPAIAAILSITAAYASNWLLPLLIAAQNEYDKLWQKLTNQRRKE